MFATPELDLDLWRVAWDGDRVAGAVRSFKERSPGAGYVDELGVRAAWRDGSRSQSTSHVRPAWVPSFPPRPDSSGPCVG